MILSPSRRAVKDSINLISAGVLPYIKVWKETAEYKNLQQKYLQYEVETSSNNLKLQKYDVSTTNNMPIDLIFLPSARYFLAILNIVKRH